MWLDPESHHPGCMTATTLILASHLQVTWKIGGCLILSLDPLSYMLCGAVAFWSKRATSNRILGQSAKLFLKKTRRLGKVLATIDDVATCGASDVPCLITLTLIHLPHPGKRIQSKFAVLAIFLDLDFLRESARELFLDFSLLHRGPTSSTASSLRAVTD